ncbi:MAG TPA: FecR domain-containing protein [Polyangiales bacterium]|nr:FecR domain-containing protein [Polyangiales bacterium]
MIRLQCTRIAALLQARAAGLSQANALVLEEHLAQCRDCSEQAQLLDGLRALSDAGAAPLSSGARQRAVLQAFAVAERPSQPTAAGSSWLFPSAFGALAATAIVVLSILRQPDLSLRADYHLISGSLEHSVRAAESGEVETAIASRSGGVVALAHARVEFRSQTRAAWFGGARVLRLESGSVVADVDPAQHQAFRVDTARFRVLVLGTRFEVSSAAVRVTRGRVRVERPDGTELAELGPGDSYACPSAPCQLRKTTVVSAEPIAASSVVPEPPPVAMPERSNSPARVERQLDQARLALAQRNLARARELVSNVLGEDLQARQRAEALSLRAESALVAGDLSEAAAAYRLVAQKFANLPAGENALFASARIDAERLSGTRAQAGLMRYLLRYPKGRFVKEATTRLRELREATPAP